MVIFVFILDIGKLAISRVWVTLREVQKLFDETGEKYALGAKQKGILLSASGTLDLERRAEIDMLRLKIVIENLLENALRYTRGEKKEIRLSIKNDATSLSLSVQDTGIGIPEKEQPKIFSEFFRASNARKVLTSGSGIGLYVCKRYIEAHAGTFRFESKENEGTNFFITLPLTTVADTNDFLRKI